MADFLDGILGQSQEQSPVQQGDFLDGILGPDNNQNKSIIGQGWQEVKAAAPEAWQNIKDVSGGIARGVGAMGSAVANSTNLDPRKNTLIGAINTGAHAIAHPIQAAQGIGNMGMGMAQPIAQDIVGTVGQVAAPIAAQGMSPIQEQVYRPVAEQGIRGIPQAIVNTPRALAQGVGNAVGTGIPMAVTQGVPEAARYALRHPANMAMDVSMAAPAVSGFARAAELPQGVAKTAEVIGNAFDPLFLPSKAVSLTASGIQKAGAPFVGKVNRPLQEKMSGLGIKTPPASSINSAKMVGTLENVAARGAGGEAFSENMLKANEELDNSYKQLFNKSAEDVDVEQLGANINDAKQRYTKAQSEYLNRLYEKADVAPGEIGIFKPKETMSYLEKMLKNRARASSIVPLESSPLEQVYANLQHKLEQNGFIDAAELGAARKQLAIQEAAAYTRPGDTTAQQLTGLIKSMDADYRTALGSARPGLLKSFDNAQREAQKVIQTKKSPMFRNITMETRGGTQSAIPENIFKSKVKVEDVRRLREMIGEDGMADVQDYVLNDIWGNSRATTRDQSEIFNSKSLDRKINKYGEQQLREILGDDKFETLKDIQHISSSFRTGNRILTENIASNATTSLIYLGFLVSHPVVTLKALFGTEIVNRFLTSGAGRKWLTNGLDKGLFLNGADIAKEVAGSGIVPMASKAGYLENNAKSEIDDYLEKNK